MTATLLALDWGTTNLRAVLLGPHGAALAVRSAAAGILRVTDSDFESALMSLCGDWLADPRLPVVASGMIGSRQGWAEAPYLTTPASPASAAASLLPIRLRNGGTLHLIAGVRCSSADGIDDVMRGEETQIWGADLSDHAIAVLPGTHSKWVRCGADGAIENFRTWMTGELYAVLSTHSILGRLMEAGGDSPDGFDLGVRRALDDPGSLGALLFSVRTAGLMARLAPNALPDYLSGLLIGAEIASGAHDFIDSSPEPGTASRSTNSDRDLTRAEPAAGIQVHLLGERTLCERYARAMAITSIATTILAPDLAARGAWRIAHAAGLIGHITA